MPVNTSLFVGTAVLLGVTIGIGGYTFVYAKGFSYVTDDPAACANCHVMREHFDAWTRSSHRAVAVCNDCHTPTGLVPKYLTKARNGFWHSFYFTTGGYPDVLQIAARSRGIAESSCRTCHAELTAAIDPAHAGSTDGGLRCTACHREVGHLE